MCFCWHYSFRCAGNKSALCANSLNIGGRSRREGTNESRKHEGTERGAGEWVPILLSEPRALGGNPLALLQQRFSYPINDDVGSLYPNPVFIRWTMNLYTSENGIIGCAGIHSEMDHPFKIFFNDFLGDFGQRD